MTKRIVPDVMVSSINSIGKQIAKEQGSEKSITARVENLREGYCPTCNSVMRVSTANGIPVHVCMDHSITMPIRDTEIL